jgi:hypothetical protein
MADVVIVNQITIIKGSDRQFSVRIVSQENQDPFNFSGVTEIKAIFRADRPPNFNPPPFPPYNPSGCPQPSPPPCPPGPPYPPYCGPVEISFTGGQIVPDPFSQGKLTLFLNEADTARLQPGQEQSFEILITLGAQLTIVQFIEALIVVSRLFPGVT